MSLVSLRRCVRKIKHAGARLAFAAAVSSLGMHHARMTLTYSKHPTAEGWVVERMVRW